MANKMLIDASHPEETRVVVLKGNRIEEFDFESEHKKQIKGNIYLAKVTRVEPSLQAAFVEYGGNRHGFLAFSEIHPDYYQIPVADRQALVEEDLLRAKEEEEQEERKMSRERVRPAAKAIAQTSDDSVSEAVSSPDGDDESPASTHAAPEGATDASFEGEAQTSEGESQDNASDEAGEGENGSEESDGEASADSARSERSGGRQRRGRSRRRGNGAEDDIPGEDEEEVIEDLGSEDAMEEVPSRASRPPRKHYKIQEVIKRRQILLVQVVKEERGNKGAALTTYLSLAGRYSVLMPNTARGGGISRKITNVADRKRLKEVVRDLEVPRGMGIILRTAGAMRTKAEVKRDYEYLMRLWETVRNLTLSSTAPSLVYEEGSLIKRSIRDLYNKEIDQILVSGENGYREAKDFMRMLLPSQAKVVQPYRDPVPIFGRNGIEAQLDRMLQPHVTLKSGGYIIINQTEALVSIDVNSGRSTREHSVEETALQTNLEAAEEVARQLRLRDLAGLIVIDFIDMDEKRNNRAVEKKMKDCLKDDRARIQVGRISHFGLLEMSRQRIRASVLESTTQTCPTCAGMGFIRSNSSLALHVIRSIEEHLQKQSTHDIIVKVPTGTALYVLNEKRKTIDEIERLHGLRIIIQADDSHGHQHVAIEQGAEAEPRPVKADVVSPLTVVPAEIEPEPMLDDVAEDEAEVEAEATTEAGSEEGGRRKRRRRRSRRGEGDETATEENGTEGEAIAAEAKSDEESREDGEAGNENGDDQGAGRKRRRRGRRGGGRRTGEEIAIGEASLGEMDVDGVNPSSDGEMSDAVASPSEETTSAVEVEAEFEEPAFGGESAPTASETEHAPVLAAEAEAPIAVEDAEEAPAAFEVFSQGETDDAPSERDRAGDEAGNEDPAAETAPDAPIAEEAPPAEEPEEPKREPLLEPLLTSNGGSQEGGEEAPKRTGWWARRSFF